MKKILIISLFLYLGFFFGGQCLGASKKDDVSAFTTSHPISNGFVFIEGQYIEAPYVVSRKGLTACVNDRVIADYAPLIKGMLSVPKKFKYDRPVIPPDLSTNAGPNDPGFKDYMSKLQSHLISIESKNLADEMVKDLKGLPCVEDVVPLSNHGVVAITFKNGEVENARLVPFGRKPAITPDTVVEHVSRACQNYVERLEKGDFYSFSNGGSRIHTFSAGTAKKAMPNIVKVLRSSQDDEEKAEELASMLGMSEIPKEQTHTFIQNIAPSKQLDERAKALCKGDEKSVRLRAPSQTK